MKWLKTKFISLKKWNEKLFTLKIKAPIDPFIAGQFTKLSYKNEKNKRIQRAYSFVNTPNNQDLEFYILLISNGLFTSMLHKIEYINLCITKQSFGFFTFNELPKKNNIWMIATGTAIGPYLSILRSENVLKKYKKIILIYAIKYLIDLNYLNILIKIKEKYKNKIIIKIILSQEKKNKYLHGRITYLFESGILENVIKEKLNSKNSHVMLCGNPNMIKDMKILLKKKKNMKIHLRRKPGHITSENYW